jgi:hypothetical protein
MAKIDDDGMFPELQYGQQQHPRQAGSHSQPRETTGQKQNIQHALLTFVWFVSSECL